MGVLIFKAATIASLSFQHDNKSEATTQPNTSSQAVLALTKHRSAAYVKAVHTEHAVAPRPSSFPTPTTTLPSPTLWTRLSTSPPTPIQASAVPPSHDRAQAMALHRNHNWAQMGRLLLCRRGPTHSSLLWHSARVSGANISNALGVELSKPCPLSLRYLRGKPRS